jgi:hypothetical protein
MLLLGRWFDDAALKQFLGEAGGAVAVAGWGLAAPKPEAVFADKSPSAIPVDVELVIAVDVCPIQWIQKSRRCSEKVTSSG